MKVDVTVRSNAAQNCADSAIDALARYWGIDYQLVYTEAWGFLFREENFQKNHKLGDAISPYHGERVDLLAKYHGVEIKLIDVTDPEEAFELIKAEILANRPLVISINHYHCHWHPFYHQVKRPHFMIVTSFDDQSKELYCKDGQYASEGVTLPFEDFAAGCDFLVTYQINEVEPVTWHEILKVATGRLYATPSHENVFENMRVFADALVEHLDIDKEIQGTEEHPLEADFFLMVYDTSRGRKQFAKTLRYLAEQQQVSALVPLAARLEKAGERWTSIFGMLTKILFLKERTAITKRVAQKIKDLAAEEEQIAQELIRLYQAEGEAAMSAHRESQSLHEEQETAYQVAEYVFVDLSDYLNSKGFDEPTLEAKADFSMGNRFYMTAGLPADSVWTAGQLRFRFPEVGPGLNDHIALEGQTIPISEGSYDLLMVLGAAEMGNHFDQIEIQYADGRTEEVTIEFSNWLHEKPSFGETIVWEGQSADLETGQVNICNWVTAKLYGTCYPLEGNGLITGIKLPYCPNIHIFAITLGRSK